MSQNTRARIADAPDGDMSDRGTSLWHMISAPVVWALHFCAVYGWTASACAHWDDAAAARWGVALATVAALALICLFGWRAWKQWGDQARYDRIHDEATPEHRREFLGHAGWLLALVSAIGVIFVALPALFIRSCL